LAAALSRPRQHPSRLSQKSQILKARAFVIIHEFCTRISALKFQWVSQRKIQLQKRRDIRCQGEDPLLWSQLRKRKPLPGGLRLYLGESQELLNRVERLSAYKKRVEGRKS
jgi:hypothetical protein